MRIATENSRGDTTSSELCFSLLESLTIIRSITILCKETLLWDGLSEAIQRTLNSWSLPKTLKQRMSSLKSSLKVRIGPKWVSVPHLYKL